MSNNVYPSLPGLTWPVGRTLLPAPVTTVVTPSQREYRVRDSMLQRYQYTLTYDFLRSAAGFQEMQTLIDFYGNQGGDFDSFLFSDPDDNTVAQAYFATGDGNTTTFQLQRGVTASASFLEPIYDFETMPIVSANSITFNLLSRPNTFNSSPWVASNAPTVASAGNLMAPYGGNDAWLITCSNAGSPQTVENQASVIGLGDLTATYYFSVFVGKTTGGISPTFAVEPFIVSGGNTTTGVIAVNTDTGAVLSGGNGVVQYQSTYQVTTSNGNQWWRVSGMMQVPKPSVVGLSLNAAYSDHGNATANVAATGAAYVFGAKIEPGGYTAYSSYTYTVSPQGLVAFSSAPFVAQTLYWTGSYYRRCRFMNGKLDTSKFMNQLFECKQVQFVSTIS